MAGPVKRPPGRPARFSREQLQAAALALVDEQGLAALSMRALAARLGTGAMTLYNHVEHREDLETLVVEAVFSGIRYRENEHADWRDDVREVAITMWKAVRAHPQTIALVLTRRTESPAALDASERMLRALARSGRSDADLLVAFRTVTALVTGFAQVELAAPLRSGRTESAREIIERVRALPEERYGRLREIAKAAGRSSAEAEFRSGLEIVLAGLSARRRK